MTMVRYAGPDTDLTPDAPTIKAFMSWWFSHCTQGMVEVGWLGTDKQLNNFQQFSLGEWDELTSFVFQENLVPGQSMYFRAATVRAGTNGRTTDADFVSAPGPWNDIDTREQMEAAQQVQTMVRANGRVVTGTIPHKRAQSFFRCDVPIVNADMVRSLNRRIYALYGGDPSVINPTRLMRMPGTIAWPWKPERQPEVTQFGVIEGRTPSYSISLLTSQLPQEDGAAQAVATQSAPLPGLGLTTASSLMAAVRAGQDWHNNMIRLVAHWIGRGFSNGEIMAAAHSLTLPGYTQAATMAEVAKAIEGARRKWGIEDREEAVEEARVSLSATSIDDLDLDNIPPRRWVYGRELVRGFASVLGSMGGTGKTAYAMVVAVSIALNKPLLSDTSISKPPPHCRVFFRGKVWLYNLEDNLEELKRRMKATMLHYKIAKSDLKGQIFIDSGQEKPLVITKRMDNGDLIASPLVDELVAEIKRRGIDVIVIDPFLESHGAEENSNEEMNLVMRLWRRVANEGNCAVWLVHHFRKGGKAGDGDSFRGAGAVQGAARAMYTMSTMSPEEANKLGVQEEFRKQYVRHDNAKSNMSPAASHATWYRLASVSLDNADPDYPDGDDVQAIEAWTPPSPWEGMPMSIIDRIFDKIESGLGNGEFYALSKQSKDRWAGHVLVSEASLTEGQASAVLKTWKENGVLEDGQYASPKQKGGTTGCVRVNATKAAEMRQTLANKGFEGGE